MCRICDLVGMCQDLGEYVQKGILKQMRESLLRWGYFFKGLILVSVLGVSFYMFLEV